ncbi:XRE family transcriptional regulator [Nocardia yunnanensis]|uniref:XRE family transcriptional regulator n=1 Tax=Nocardia yunnanensis TaxID=2382165 RepID=A0A386Z9N0_9NOCA|nr:helix-turn-helix transcriptional regulator [Nocardia yunnanensis]AYF74256.1 XRE family transcriptional regulator [Nocardia yunnanensis]
MTRTNPVGEPIGELVRRLRKERGLTQQSLADRAKCSRSQIQQIEAGTRVPQRPLRESLSAVLGVALPAIGPSAAALEADSGIDSLRMQFNVLLGKDPAAAAHALRITQQLVDAAGAAADTASLRTIALRQLARAESVLAQVPSRMVHIPEWNTVTDWCTILEQATRSVRTVHAAGLAVIGGEVGDEYHSALMRLAARTGAARLSMRRIQVIDSIADLWPYDDRLWRLTRAGITNLVVKRIHAPNAQGMLLVDERFSVSGVYDNFREGRLATRISALRPDVDFFSDRFAKLEALSRQGKAIRVNDLIATEPLSRFAQLDEGECRALFHAALERAWDALPSS